MKMVRALVAVDLRAAIRANPSPAARERKPLGTTEGAP